MAETIAGVQIPDGQLAREAITVGQLDAYRTFFGRTKKLAEGFSLGC